jgi:protein SCO1
MTVLRVALLLVLWTITAHAAVQPDLRDFAYQQKPGAQLPSGETFRDATGREVRIADLLRGKPAILALGYFSCPNLCGVVRADLYNALAQTGMIAGRDYTLIALSIDPAETSSDAAKAKAADTAQYPLPGAAQNWHFLTGAAADVRAVSDAVGFRDRFDSRLKQFLHPAGIVFVTPGGVVSSYLLGVGYAAQDVRLGVTRASTGSIAARALPVLLLCFHFDPTTGRYTLAILKLLKLGAGLTVLVIGGTLFLAFRRERRAP